MVASSIYNELINITVMTFIDIFLSFILIIGAWIELGRIDWDTPILYRDFRKEQSGLQF